MLLLLFFELIATLDVDQVRRAWRPLAAATDDRCLPPFEPINGQQQCFHFRVLYTVPPTGGDVK